MPMTSILLAAATLGALGATLAMAQQPPASPTQASPTSSSPPFVSAGYAIAPAGTFDASVVPAPMYRDPIHDGAADPSIVYDARDGSWLMYYTQRRANVPCAGVDWCYGCKVGIAKSTDKGKTWEYVGVCLGIERGKQAETFWAPHVFVHDGTFHMIVTYIPRIGGQGNWGGKPSLAYYTSVDGERWTDVGLIDVGSDNIIDPAVVRLKDGRWLLVFRDDNAGTKTAMCTSTDLATWTRLPAAVGEQKHEGPVIFHWKGKFWLVADDWNGLVVYESDDGLTYKSNGRILQQPGKRREDNVRGGHAGVAVAGDQAYVFYFTHPGRAPDAHRIMESSPGTHTHESNRTSIQVAELGVEDGKLVAHRDQYAK